MAGLAVEQVWPLRHPCHPSAGGNHLEAGHHPLQQRGQAVQLRADQHQRHHLLGRERDLAQLGNLQIFLWDQRGVFPLRRAVLHHEVRQLDLRWGPGQPHELRQHDRPLQLRGQRRVGPGGGQCEEERCLLLLLPGTVPWRHVHLHPPKTTSFLR